MARVERMEGVEKSGDGKIRKRSSCLGTLLARFARLAAVDALRLSANARSCPCCSDGFSARPITVITPDGGIINVILTKS
jgi:hypothetical protein